MRDARCVEEAETMELVDVIDHLLDRDDLPKDLRHRALLLRKRVLIESGMSRERTRAGKEP